MLYNIRLISKKRLGAVNQSSASDLQQKVTCILLVNTTGLSDSAQLNILRNKHRVVVASMGKNQPYDEHGSNFSKMFSELFPFGRGHPAEKRKNRVSVLECIKHYLSLSSRKFAQHHQFLAVAFDKISLGNMYMANYLQCRKNSNNNSKIAKVTEEELAQFLIDKSSNNIQDVHASTDGVNILMKSNI